MRYMMTYDLMETLRNTNQWLGASAKSMASYPIFAMVPNPGLQWIRAWGEVTERSFERMAAKPDWGIDSVTCEDGKDHVVQVRTEMKGDFGDLIHFDVSGRKTKPRKILLVAPMSGHYATLLRSTVKSLIPDCEVYITDWHNARDIPVSAGKFDVEDYTLYLVDYMRQLGPDTHVIAVCQPAPLTLAATAYLAEEDPKAQPASLTLIGGPIDPDATPTEVTDFGRRVTMGQLEETMIQRVGFKYKGVGRAVYPGLLQLSSFMSMNADRHSQAFNEQILRVARGEASDHDAHNRFYDEYLAVMDMTAEFYLSTVERIFKNGEIAKNAFVVDGKQVDIGKITDVAVKTVEGANDDISAPGQCVAALALCTGLDESKKASHLEPGAGHYGIFAGRSWRDNIRPLVLEFIDQNSRNPVKAKPAQIRAVEAAPAGEKLAQAEPAKDAAATPAEAKPAAAKPRASTRAAAKPVTAKTTKAQPPAKAKPATAKRKPAKTSPTKATAPKVQPVEPKPAPTTASEAKPAEAQPVQAKAGETKPAEAKPAPVKASEPKPAGGKPGPVKASEPKPDEAKSAPAKVSETKPAEAKPVPAKASEAKSAATQPAPAKASDAKPAEAKPDQPKPTAAKSDSKPAEAQTDPAGKKPGGKRVAAE